MRAPCSCSAHRKRQTTRLPLARIDKDGCYLQKLCPRCSAAARTLVEVLTTFPLDRPRHLQPGRVRFLTGTRQLGITKPLFGRKVTDQPLGRTYPMFAESQSHLLSERWKGGFPAISCPQNRKRDVEATTSPAIPPAAQADFPAAYRHALTHPCGARSHAKRRLNAAS